MRDFCVKNARRAANTAMPSSSSCDTNSANCCATSGQRLAKTTKTKKGKRLDALANFCALLISAFYLSIICKYSSVHSCSYQVPDAGNVILNVPFTIDSIDDSHAHKKHDSDFDFGSSTANDVLFVRKKQRLKRDSVIERAFEPLRIALYYDPASIQPLSVEKQLFINSSLLPQAIGFWEKALSVRPSRAPIRLSRKCKSNHYYLDASETRPTCVERCRSETTCGEVFIPDEHLFQCRFCSRDVPSPLTCKFAGPADGAGVGDADFLLYVSAVNSTRCENEDTIAYAAHCQQEAELDRPIAGHVNICPNALSTHAHDREILLSTVKHEILHALGFSAGLYAFFRHGDGQPRTKRNRFNRPTMFNREKSYYDADDSTVRTVIRHDWWTAEGTVPHPIHLMVTERVTNEARKHFKCMDLEGAELENQGGEGTALTHWEKRLFENEAMTGTHTQNPVYSRLTLALMEDSGWYKANYSVAEHLHWGNGLGCEFSMKSCGEWIKTKLEGNTTTAPFCHHIKHDGRKSLATTRCTDQRDSLALCNLIPYKKPLPVEFRNFAALQGVRKEGVKYYGGSVELADYCPYNQEFEWKSTNSTERRRDSRCELRGNAPPLYANSVMEEYGNRSRCFNLAATWTERKCGRVKTYTQFMAGCYQFSCRDGRVNLKIVDSPTFYPCYYAGQPIYIRRIINGWLREGAIQCPACEEICAESQYWHFAHTKHNTLDAEFNVRNGVEEENNGALLKEPLEESSDGSDDVFETILVNDNSGDANNNEDDVTGDGVTLAYTSSESRTTTRELALPKSPLRYGIKERREVNEKSAIRLRHDLKCAPELKPDELYADVGDPPLDEPCSTTTIFATIKFTVILQVFFTISLSKIFVQNVR